MNVDADKVLPLVDDFSGYEHLPKVLLLALRSLAKRQRDADLARMMPLIEASQRLGPEQLAAIRQHIAIARAIPLGPGDRPQLSDALANDAEALLEALCVLAGRVAAPEAPA